MKAKTKPAAKRVTPKKNPIDPKSKKTASKTKPKPKKTAFNYGADDRKSKRAGKG